MIMINENDFRTIHNTLNEILAFNINGLPIGSTTFFVEKVSVIKEVFAASSIRSSHNKDAPIPRNDIAVKNIINKCDEVITRLENKWLGKNHTSITKSIERLREIKQIVQNLTFTDVDMNELADDIVKDSIRQTTVNGILDRLTGNIRKLDLSQSTIGILLEDVKMLHILSNLPDEETEEDGFAKCGL
jgi:hypothetical protein